MYLKNQCALMHFFSIRIGSVGSANVLGYFDNESKQTRMASHICYIFHHIFVCTTAHQFLLLSHLTHLMQREIHFICTHPWYTYLNKIWNSLPQKGFHTDPNQCGCGKPKTIFWICIIWKLCNMYKTMLI